MAHILQPGLYDRSSQGSLNEKIKDGRTETDGTSRTRTERNAVQVSGPGNERPAHPATCRGQPSPQLSVGEHTGAPTALLGAFFQKVLFPFSVPLAGGHEDVRDQSGMEPAGREVNNSVQVEGWVEFPGQKEEEGTSTRQVL